MLNFTASGNKPTTTQVLSGFRKNVLVSLVKCSQEAEILSLDEFHVSKKNNTDISKIFAGAVL
jgi:hypothetical protein